MLDVLWDAGAKSTDRKLGIEGKGGLRFLVGFVVTSKIRQSSRQEHMCERVVSIGLDGRAEPDDITVVIAKRDCGPSLASRRIKGPEDSAELLRGWNARFPRHGQGSILLEPMEA
jgi:hypothetical protein